VFDGSATTLTVASGFTINSQATGTLNGGGPRVVVSTRSGSIRLRKGPPAP